MAMDHRSIRNFMSIEISEHGAMDAALPPDFKPRLRRGNAIELGELDPPLGAVVQRWNAISERVGIECGFAASYSAFGEECHRARRSRSTLSCEWIDDAWPYLRLVKQAYRTGIPTHVIHLGLELPAALVRP